MVEVEGHATHSSRRQRQADEARRTALTLAGRRVIVFTFDDVFDRGDWVMARLREALARDVASMTRSRTSGAANSVAGVDVAGFEGDADARRAVVEAVAAACAEVGFLTIVGHGVPESVIAGAWPHLMSKFRSTVGAAKPM